MCEFSTEAKCNVVCADEVRLVGNIHISASIRTLVNVNISALSVNRNSLGQTYFKMGAMGFCVTQLNAATELARHHAVDHIESQTNTATQACRKERIENFILNGRINPSPVITNQKHHRIILIDKGNPDSAPSARARPDQTGALWDRLCRQYPEKFADSAASLKHKIPHTAPAYGLWWFVESS